MTSIGYVLLLSSFNFLIIFLSTVLCQSTIPLDHGAPATVDFIVILNCSQTSRSSSLLNLSPLSDKITLGAPKIPIQYLIITSETSSFFLFFTAASALYLVAWSIRCKIYVVSNSFKSTAATSLISLDKQKATVSLSFGFFYFKHMSQMLSSVSISLFHSSGDFKDNSFVVRSNFSDSLFLSKWSNNCYVPLMGRHNDHWKWKLCQVWFRKLTLSLAKSILTSSFFIVSLLSKRVKSLSVTSVLMTMFSFPILDGIVTDLFAVLIFPSPNLKLLKELLSTTFWASLSVRVFK